MGVTKMSKPIKVAVLNVESQEFEIIDNFNHELENMQKVVGGYIEALTVHESDNGRELVVWLNEEGKLIGLEPNFVLAIKETGKVADIVMGNVLITAVNEKGDTAGLTDADVQTIKQIFEFGRSVVTPAGLVTKVLWFE